MLNRLTIALKAAGLNHKQIKSVMIGGLEEQARQDYRLMRIWPGGVNMNSEVGGGAVYRFVVAVTDRHQDNPTSQLEAMSDCTQILLDILASLQYNYKGTGTIWSIADTIEHGYDEEPDKVAGATVTFLAKTAYNRDFCQVPSNDYAFPNMNLDLLTIIDGGDAEFESELEIIDGGTA
jgi:hypothetical protein